MTFLFYFKSFLRMHLQNQQQHQMINGNGNYNNSLNYHSRNNTSSSHSNSQHQPLTNVFPSIYNEINYNNHQHLHHMMASSNGQNQTPTHLSVSSLNNSTSMPTYSSVQRQIQQDWSNREFIEIIVSNIKKMTDFLNSFELSCRSKLSLIDEKLTKLERQIDYVEAKVTKGDTLN